MSGAGIVKNLESLSALHVKRQSSTTPSGSTVISYTKDLGHGPVLWLVHGYPQSAYMYVSIFPSFMSLVLLLMSLLVGVMFVTQPCHIKTPRLINPIIRLYPSYRTTSLYSSQR
jgi:hypothetical protein